MIKSMTGFGRGSYTKEGREYLIEIKTVNHRYSDISVRISRTYSYLEPKIREILSKKVVRGKIDVNVWVEDYGTSGRNVLLDEGLSDLYIDALNKIKQKYDISEEISLSLVSRFPDILKLKKEDDDEDMIWNEMKTALDQAIDSLIQMREKEGYQLKIDILEKSSNLDRYITGIESRAPHVVIDYKTKLQNRIKDIIGNAQLDEGRLEIEVALFADRCSIEEEITQFKSHIKQLNQIVEINEPIGRKLDFLIQEFNREINTIGSKANDLEITKIVVEAKSEIEKIREQIQNIE